jgi:hypothetical protein
MKIQLYKSINYTLHLKFWLDGVRKHVQLAQTCVGVLWGVLFHAAGVQFLCSNLLCKI